ncbi:MAG: hypothetical protein V3T70_08225 [Phycisphaerae bacterium]
MHKSQQATISNLMEQTKARYTSDEAKGDRAKLRERFAKADERLEKRLEARLDVLLS